VHLLALHQGLWDLSYWECFQRQLRGPRDSIVPEQTQVSVQPLPTPPLPAEALTLPGTHQVTPNLLFHPVAHIIELVNWELKSALGLGQHQVSGNEKRSTNSVGIAVLAYLFLLRVGHREIVPGQSWSIFQLQHTLQLRALTNQVEHNVKVKMARGRKAA
jgi:hypothetical protein